MNKSKLVFATNNLNKLSEIKDLLPNFQILDLNDIKCYVDLPETKSTIEGNSLQKAKYIYDNFGYNCFADDTGLEIDELSGEPGVYSARYAGEDCNAKNNIKKVLQKLDGIKNRSAMFKTIITLILDGNEYQFKGLCKGIITDFPIGNAGFGYDSIFVPDNYSKTFAQMSRYEKGLISHRAIATKKLCSFFMSKK